MFSSEIYLKRRAELTKRVSKGVILLPGNVESPFNYPNNTYPFRQDSTFLYYFGQNVPSLAAVIDAESGVATMYGDDFTVEDIIWMGPQAKISELAAEVGVSESKPMAKLYDDVREAIAKGREVHYLPPYRGETKLMLCDLLGKKPEELHAGKSIDLMFAVAEMRERKGEEEIAALEEAFEIGYQMHTTAMRYTRPGRTEHEVAAMVDAMALRYGTGVSFTTIFSQHGEVLHNHDHSGILTDGRLVLCDCGGEHKNNYVSDHTRTFPVNGKFTQKQKDIYNIVLAAQQQAPENMRAGAMYMEDVHRKALITLAEGLRGVGLINGSAEDAVAAGAMFLFMPHGLSHGMGIDVHDCEAMGERSYDFSAIAERAAESATCIHRATWRLRAGTVMSNEPGIYFIPALIDKSRSEGLYKGIVNYDKLDSYRDFGGIRIEDDVIVTENGGRVIGGEKKIPVTVEELEAFLS